MDKFYIHDFDEPQMSKALDSFLQVKQKSPTQLVAVLDREQVLDDNFMKDMGEFLKVLAEKGIRPHDVSVAVSGKDKIYSPSDWQKIKEVNDKLKAKSISFGVEDSSKVWDIQEVENANKQIDESADKLRGKNLSPMEKLLSAYLEVTRRNYKFEDKTEHFSKSRSIYGVLNSDKIVCVGYAELLKTIMEREGDPNIKLYSNSVAVSHDNEHLAGYHRNLIVYIKDEKYGLDGYYYMDPTWDSAKSNKNEFRLNHFLLPLNDIQYISDHIRDRDIQMERAPVKSTSKPKHVTEKTKKAIAKNKHRTYNAVSGGNSSFSSDKFVLSEPLQAHVMKNDPVVDRLDEYFDLQDELFPKPPQVQNEKVELVEEIKNYFKENHINYLPYSVGDKLKDLIKNNASLEECIDYAESVVKDLRYGKSNIQPDQFIHEFSESLRKDLEKDLGLQEDLEFLEILKTGENEEMIKEYETKVQGTYDRIDTIINVLNDLFKENPEVVYALCDSNTVCLQEDNFSFLVSDLYFAGNDPQAIRQALESNANNHMSIYSINEIFLGAEYAAARDAKQPPVDDKAEDRRQKNILVYEALCDSSSPITYDQMSRALTVVLSKNRPDLEPSKIATAVKQIMDINVQRSKNRFSEGATNVFYQQYNNIRQAQEPQVQTK